MSWSKRIYWPSSPFFQTSLKCLQNVFKGRLQDVLKTCSKGLQDVFRTSSGRIPPGKLVLLTRFQDVLKTPSRRFQDVFKTSSICLQDVFKTSSRRLHEVFKKTSRCIIQGKLILLKRLQHVFKAYCEHRYLRKDSPWPNFLRNLWSWLKFIKSELFDIRKLLLQFFRKHYTVIASKINMLLQKSGIMKHVAISVNNESTNNSSSKKYSIRFSFLQDLLVAAYKNTWDRISQENNSAGNDLFVVHFDQNFGCNFWMNR